MKKRMLAAIFGGLLSVAASAAEYNISVDRVQIDTGDFVVVVNCEKVKVTGNKAKDKIYHAHSGYPGGLKSISFEKLIERAPERVIQNAVKGMLPKNALGRAMFKKLKVYAGSEHPHGAQQPQAVQF